MLIVSKNKYDYDKALLKVSREDIEKQYNNSSSEIDVVESTTEEEELSNIKALLVIVMLIAMYAIISAIPTFVLMYFFGVGFWTSQIIVLIGLVIIVPLFGLHKPASKKQKLRPKFLL